MALAILLCLHKAVVELDNIFRKISTADSGFIIQVIKSVTRNSLTYAFPGFFRNSQNSLFTGQISRFSKFAYLKKIMAALLSKFNIFKCDHFLYATCWDYEISKFFTFCASRNSKLLWGFTFYHMSHIYRKMFVLCKIVWWQVTYETVFENVSYKCFPSS